MDTLRVSADEKLVKKRLKKEMKNESSVKVDNHDFT